MFQFLPSEPPVIAAQLSGKMLRRDIEAYLDRLEASLASEPRTHLFIEVTNFSGLELDGLGDHVGRAVTLLGKLEQLGRVAMVADQKWLRWAAKIESALLPKVRYETFTSEERDQALAWVEGRRDQPHAPALKVIETDNPDVFGFELDGKVGAAELEAISHYFEAALERKRPLRLLGRIKHIGGFEMAGLRSKDYLEMKRDMLRHVERYALVGGPAWLKAWVAALDPFFNVDLRHFEADEEVEAWVWLDASPQTERTLLF